MKVFVALEANFKWSDAYIRGYYLPEELKIPGIIPYAEGVYVSKKLYSVKDLDLYPVIYIAGVEFDVFTKNKKVWVVVEFEEANFNHFLGGVFATKELAEDYFDRKTKRAIQKGSTPSTLVSIVEKEIIEK